MQTKASDLIPSVLIGPSSFAECDRTPLEKLVHAGFHVIHNPYHRKLTRHEVKQLLGPHVCGVIAGLEPLDREVLEGASLKVISRVGSGLSNVDVEFCKASGIQVFSTPDGPTEAVAELTIGILLSLLRMVPQMNAALHGGKWEKQIGIQLQGKTVAIVGYGRIGRRVAELLQPYEIDLIVVDPVILPASLTYGRLLLLEQALPLADIVTFHHSGDVQFIGEKEIALMKRGVFLLNAARGQAISEGTLVHALQTGKVAGAWLDVFSEEPYQGELGKFPQIILTPHVGSYTVESRVAMELEAVENLLKAIDIGVSDE